MQERHLRLQSQLGWFLTLITSMMATSVLAETANFGSLKLSPGFAASQGTTSGYTGGAYSLSAISNRDLDKNLCIGFADPNPDHILVLEKDFDNLKILVNSGGNDTTLLIKGPDDQTIRCGDDTGRSKDASVSNKKWRQGTYHIWVGMFDQGVKRNYVLTVQQ
ncbi:MULTISPECIES: hypothetical protein [unclassified Anabaena]|uniref:hypothetical protein n=1 Tax=unclassified Anabaena TaxID=2619674 RepID=UPI00144666B1|nr:MULTISPECIES: hypothetical protein [unclassified Anabaena]MTJ10382.1 hypothetical protein [Anabaena sp. UHCC 0204]MTJ53902.1 hypothetical protein [Anabaena sp. UHCC 0253]